MAIPHHHQSPFPPVRLFSRRGLVFFSATLIAVLLPVMAEDNREGVGGPKKTVAQLPGVGPDGRAVADAPDRRPDIHFVPTPQAAVDKMLELAEIREGDIVYDLGCGDGRIVVTAAQRYGVRAVGVDIDPERVLEAKEAAKDAGVESLVTIRHADIFDLDLGEADVVMLYLLPDLNVRLMPQLRQLKPGSRIVSFQFDMRGARPAAIHRENFGESYERTIYKWVVPWEEESDAHADYDDPATDD